MPDNNETELRAHPRVSKLLEVCAPEHKASLDRAIKEIASYSDADLHGKARAVCKTFRAISGHLRIFISYRSAHHKEAAEQLHDVLDSLGAKKINVFWDKVSIEAGRPWNADIRYGIKNSHFLIIIVPDESDEREWPIFEAGFFAGNMTPSDRLIPLHHSKIKIPTQIGEFQGKIADAPGIEDLLRQVLVKENAVPGLEPINPASAPMLSDYAKKIASLITGRIHPIPRHTMCYIRLELDRHGPVKTQAEILNAVVTDGRACKEVFGYSGGFGVPFKTILGGNAGLKRHAAWLAEFTDVIVLESNHKFARSPFVSFPSYDNTREYRPYLHTVEEDTEQNAIGLQIVFGELFAGKVEGPQELEVLRTSLRLAARFRWEVLQRYERMLDEVDLADIEEKVRRIEAEAKVHGILDVKLLLDQFEGEDQCKLEQMNADYSRLHDRLGGNGEFDQALKNKNVVAVRTCLKELKKINKEFTVLATRRYAELVVEYW